MGRIIIPNPSDFPMKADLVVIGGGIVGTATAFWASRKGLKTIVLEKGQALGALTTAASAECFRAQWERPENIEMVKASIDIFENFAEVIGIPGYEIGLHQQGYLFITDDPDGERIFREEVTRLKSLGVDDVEFLSGKEVVKIFPFLSESITAGRFREKDGWLSAHETTYGFAKGSSAQFFLQTTAVDIPRDKGGLTGVKTDKGVINARAVVIAAGPFSGQVAKLAGVDLPPLKGIYRRQKMIVSAHDEIPQGAPMTIDYDTGFYWRPEAGRALLGGGKALPEDEEPRESVPTDWRFPAIVFDAVSRLTPFWAKVSKEFSKLDIKQSAGQYTLTFNSKPIIGPCPSVNGLFFNLGYSGHGVMGAPQGGKLLVELILDPTLDLKKPNPFSARPDIRKGFPPEGRALYIRFDQHLNNRISRN